jgi:hypothetical protein
MSKLKEPKYDISFAVFNQHINNAGERAHAVINKMYSNEDADVIKFNKDYKEGIMNIFNREPDYVTNAYVALVFYFVNYGKNK